MLLKWPLAVMEGICRAVGKSVVSLKVHVDVLMKFAHTSLCVGPDPPSHGVALVTRLRVV